MRVGLTGGVASGKSTVSAILRELGAVVIDADALAREVVGPGTPGLAAVVAAFGPEVLGPDGALDRPRLGALVFADAERRTALEAIVHPLVRPRASELEASAPLGAVVVHDIPLLVETGQAGALRRGAGRRRTGRRAGRPAVLTGDGRGRRPRPDRGSGVAGGAARGRDARHRQRRNAEDLRQRVAEVFADLSGGA